MNNKQLNIKLINIWHRFILLHFDTTFSVNKSLNKNLNNRLI